MTANRRVSSRRNGYLMLDLIIVMLIVSVVLSTSSVWVYKTMHYSMEVKQRDQHARTISRISRQLRLDAQFAESLAVDGMQLSILQSDETKIDYSIESNTIKRKVKGGSQPHHDEFKFATNAELAWNDGSSPNSVLLDIRRDASAKLALKSQQSKRIDAQVRISCSPGEKE